MLEILDIAVALPDQYQTMAEASIELSLSHKDSRMYARFFGLHTFPHDATEPLAKMVERAVAGLAPGRDDLVVHCHTLLSSGPSRADTLLPIQLFAGDAGCEAFSATMCHCASGVAVLELLERMLSQGQTALVIVADKAFHPAVRLIRNTTIMGEGAVAMRVGHRIEPQRGRYAFVGGHTERRGRYSIITGRLDDVTDPGFAEEYVDLTATCIERAVSKAGLAIGDLRFVLPHNVNLPSWDQIAQRLGAIRGQIFLQNVARYGHTFGADPFLNLVDAERAGLLATADHVALVSVGLGATAACAILRVGERANIQEMKSQPEWSVA
jgi:3-oxoacyl-[acyl-carrier-protein] synthase III